MHTTTQFRPFPIIATTRHITHKNWKEWYTDKDWELVSLSPANSPLRQEHHRSRRRSAAPRSCRISWGWSSRFTMERFIRMWWLRRRWLGGSWGSLLREFFSPVPFFSFIPSFFLAGRAVVAWWRDSEDLKAGRGSRKILGDWGIQLVYGLLANWLVIGRTRKRFTYKQSKNKWLLCQSCVVVWLAGCSVILYMQGTGVFTESPLRVAGLLAQEA